MKVIIPRADLIVEQISQIQLVVAKIREARAERKGRHSTSERKIYSVFGSLEEIQAVLTQIQPQMKQVVSQMETQQQMRHVGKEVQDGSLKVVDISTFLKVIKILLILFNNVDPLLNKFKPLLIQVESHLDPKESMTEFKKQEVQDNIASLEREASEVSKNLQGQKDRLQAIFRGLQIPQEEQKQG